MRACEQAGVLEERRRPLCFLRLLVSSRLDSCSALQLAKQPNPPALRNWLLHRTGWGDRRCSFPVRLRGPESPHPPAAALLPSLAEATTRERIRLACSISTPMVQGSNLVKDPTAGEPWAYAGNQVTSELTLRWQSALRETDTDLALLLALERTAR